MTPNKSEKRVSRLRRAKRTRMKIRELNVPRLVVHRSLKHIYAQIIREDKVVVCASSLEKDFQGGKTGNVETSGKIGNLIGERALKAGVESVAFDRSGFKYHGRVKALAEGAREAGLKF